MQAANNKTQGAGKGSSKWELTMTRAELARRKRANGEPLTAAEEEALATMDRLQKKKEERKDRERRSPFAIVKAIEKEKGICFRFHDARYWIYNREEGVWRLPKRGGGQHDGAGDVRGIVSAYLAELDARGEGVGFTLSYTIQNVCEAARANPDLGLEPPVFTADGPAWKKGDSAADWVAMKNGLLDLRAAASGKEKVLHDFTPAFFSTRRLPFAYDAAATCPHFDKALENIVPDAEARDVLWKFLGLLLFDDTRWQVFLVLVGVNGSGKSVLVEVAKAIVGEHASMQFVELLDPFKVGDATRFGASIADDPRWPSKNLRPEMESTLLTLISGEGAEVNDSEKYVQGVARRVRARFLFAQNAVPRWDDPDKRQALNDRMRVIHCPKHIRGTDEGDKDFFNREIRPELPGIFARAVREYGELANLGDAAGKTPFRWFPNSKASRELVENETLPEVVFLRTHFHAAERGAVRPQEIRDGFAAWCKARGMEMPKWRFGFTLQTVFPKCNPNGGHRFPLPNGKKGKTEKAVVGIEPIPADAPPSDADAPPPDDAEPLASKAEVRPDDFAGIGDTPPGLDNAPPPEDAPPPVADDWKPATP